MESAVGLKLQILHILTVLCLKRKRCLIYQLHCKQPTVSFCTE